MGKSTGSAPDPDPNIGKSALLQARTGRQWLNFARDAFQVSTERQQELDALTKRVTNAQLGVMKDQNAFAEQQRERYNTVFKPLENKFINQAENYGSVKHQNEMAAEARADVLTAADSQKETAERQAEAMGLNPNSGRYQALDRSATLDTALAAAGAENTARQQVRDKGLALKADVANMGRGVPAQAASATSLGLSAGQAALAGNQSTNAQYLASTDIMGSGFKGQMAGYAGEGSTLNQQYGLQLDAWKTEQQMAAQNAAGIGSAIGGLAGIIFSDEEMKEDKEEIPDGQALTALKNMPVEEWNYKPGVADGGRHVGTYAQDFKRETGKGDGHSIPVQDALGITMKAVQDLDNKIDKIADAIGLGQEDT
jgi:hypothetical protein